ncbi:hypothetical protein [Mycobacterium sp.]|uniref:hypothetical protein n=1 Tax=Mycobacterium sp. TaxID=1785 RepID=UPI003F9D864B
MTGLILAGVHPVQAVVALCLVRLVFTGCCRSVCGPAVAHRRQPSAKLLTDWP